METFHTLSATVNKRLGAGLMLASMLGTCASLISWMAAGPLVGASLLLGEILVLCAVIWGLSHAAPRGPLQRTLTQAGFSAGD